MSGTAALADLGSNAMDIFRKVDKALKESADTAWPDDLLVAESDRFELWAANMGLFVAGHGSLDYRVREAERLAQTLRRFMQDLINSLDDGKASPFLFENQVTHKRETVFQLCSGASQEGASGLDKSSGERSETERTRDEGEEEHEDEDDEGIDMELLLDGVRDPINRLFKMSTKIRNPSTRLGSSRAANYRQIDEDTGVDFLEAIKESDLDYVASVFLEYRKVRACQENHPAEPPGGPLGENDDEVWEPIRTVLIQEQERQRTGVNFYLIERIAQANCRRRQQFAYWAKHRDKLDKHTKSYQAKKTQFPTAQPHRAVENTPGTVPSVTTATRLDVARLEVSDNRSSWTLSEYAPSTRQAGHAPVDFPPAPKRSRSIHSDKFFECPYCFFLCPKEILADKAWKAHLIHDLRPYICTYEDCKNPTQLYDSRQDWVQHENSEHRKIWRCLDHSDQVFKSLETYKHHLQEQHGGSISGEASSIRIIQASESVSDILNRACPICMAELDTTRAMESHIALHLERFARFSLPRSIINDDDDGSNADSDRANRVDEEGSRDDDFEGGSELHSDIDGSEAQATGRLSETGRPSTPHRVETTEGILQAFQPLGDDDDDSSESGQAQHEVQQTSEDEASSDDFEVGEWCTDPEKYMEVEQSYREAVEQSEKTLGREHPDTLKHMDRLSSLLSGQRKYEEAEQINREVLGWREKVLGREHPDTLDSMRSLGNSLYVQDKHMETEQVERETLELREKLFGREHSGTLCSMSNLAMTLYEMGRYEESEVLEVEVLETRKRTLGHAHHDTLQSMINLVLTLGKLGKPEEAERLGAETMEMCKQELGIAHPDTLCCMFNMANLFWDQDRFEEAEKLELEVLEARKRTVGPAHPDTLMSMANLAVTWHFQGLIAEAIALIDSCAQLRCQVLGPEHPDTARAMELLEAWRAERENQQ